MFRFITEPIDRLAIKAACPTVHVGEETPSERREAQELIHDPEFLAPQVPAAALRPDPDGYFSFPTPLPSRWRENNIVYGRWLKPDGMEWQTRPLVILLHGWNGEHSYQYLFPWLLPRLAKSGFNAVMFELPYHRQRKPREAGAVTNFLSTQVLSNVKALRQSLGEVQALSRFFKDRGCPRTAVWGHSMGGYLTGCMCVGGYPIDAGVLMAPVPRMDAVIQELDFCQPLRDSLKAAPISFTGLNLDELPLRLPPSHVLIVEALHDLFTPASRIDELWKAWGKPEIWRLNHGHITILFALRRMRQIIRWLTAKL